MPEKLLLGFCVHSHQPVGNFDTVFRQGYQECYRPLLEILRDYPQIRMTLHYTGPLLEWFDQNTADFFPLLKELVDRSQVELMGGGFYEPIMPVIPEDDAKEQIRLMNQYLFAKFGLRPRGLWCAERIWDPSLPIKLVSDHGGEYTLLDDSHFLSAGLSSEDVQGYFITEREGRALKVFPIDMRLRYLIPFKEPDVVIDYLLQLKARGVHLVTYGDDGEKFGMWPGTHEWVIQKGWLRRFFDALLDSGDQIEMVPLSHAIVRCPPEGLIYLPTATYQEMMEWSLFARQGRYYEDLVKKSKATNTWEKDRAFLRGGIWDNFLAKYPESNLMHKKMLKVSSLIREYSVEEEALPFVLQAQCNCAYWHGLFGGIYIAALRHAVYENLLKAEEIVNQKRFQLKDCEVEILDYDRDGRDEVLISGKVFNCFISPHTNASVFALEHVPTHYNFSNTLMRHPEIYHRKIEHPDIEERTDIPKKAHAVLDIEHLTEEQRRELLVYDTYQKHSFMTHVVESLPHMDILLKENRINGSPATVMPFELVEKTVSDTSVELDFRGSRGSLVIHKTYRYDSQGSITLSHAVPEQTEGWIVLEWNIMSLYGQRPWVDACEMEEDHGFYQARSVEIEDGPSGVHLVLESPADWDVCIVPIECLSQSEEGFEKTFQGWSIYFIAKCTDDIPDVTVLVKPGIVRS
ncbi:MAG: alpha-amylase/4-alpha-glucanotransferase domain-containing protein [Desulfomonilia bacterium]